MKTLLSLTGLDALNFSDYLLQQTLIERITQVLEQTSSNEFSSLRFNYIVEDDTNYDGFKNITSSIPMFDTLEIIVEYMVSRIMEAVDVAETLRDYENIVLMSITQIE